MKFIISILIQILIFIKTFFHAKTNYFYDISKQYYVLPVIITLEIILLL